MSDGKIIFELPVFTGNAMRTLFTRRNKNRQEEVRLPADPSNQSAKSLMDTLQTILDENYINLFSNNNYRRDFPDRRTYQKLLNLSLSDAIIQNNTQKFFDLRQGICINRNTQSMIPGRNYSIEAVFKGSEFNFTFNLPSDKRNEALVMLNEWREGRFFFGGGKSRGLGWGRADIPEWDTLIKDYSKPQNFNRNANYFEITLKLPLDEPLLINWNYGIFMPGGVYHYNENESACGDAIRKLLDGEKGHKEKVRIAESRGGKAPYESRGKIIQVEKENFVKAAQNDRNIINFFKTYGEDIKRFIDNNYKDYRETEKKPDNTGYGSKEYDKFPIRVKNGNSFGSICIPGSTLKGAFRARAQQIIETLFESKYHCKVCKKFGTQDDQCTYEQQDRVRTGKCICCSMFGGQHDGEKDKKILFIDAYPDDDSKIHLYPADSVPVDRLSGKSLNKSNLLFAYNPEAFMKCRIVLRNVKPDEKWMITLLGHILEDLSEGDIPIGSGKFTGLGRLKGQVENIKIGCHSDSWLYNDIGRDKFQSGFFWDESLLTGDAIRTFLGNYQTDLLNVKDQQKFNTQNQQQQNFQNRGGYRNGRY